MRANLILGGLVLAMAFLSGCSTTPPADNGYLPVRYSAIAPSDPSDPARPSDLPYPLAHNHSRGIALVAASGDHHQE